MGKFVVRRDDPTAGDIRALLVRHLTEAKAHSPPQDMHALDIAGLQAVDISFFSIRENEVLVGIGALKQLDDLHAEIKSMHTAKGARRSGAGRAMVDHLLAVAWARGCRRVSLETGSMAIYAPARALYESAGFQICEPFAEYERSPNSVYMTFVPDWRSDPDAGS